MKNLQFLFNMFTLNAVQFRRFRVYDIYTINYLEIIFKYNARLAAKPLFVVGSIDIPHKVYIVHIPITRMNYNSELEE